jgi:antitoxin ParD1/3/4
MDNGETFEIAVTPEVAAELQAAVTGGEYASVDEIIDDALRDWRLRRKLEAHELDALRRLVQEGIDSGPGLDADAVFARLLSKFERSAE